MGQADACSRRAWRRRWLGGPMVWALLAAAVDTSVVVAGEIHEGSDARRVRAHGEAIRSAVAVGLERSATFRRLHETIDASDGMVYVIEGMCGHGVHACLLLRVWVAGPYRVLLIRVDPTKAAGCELVGLIGHELQHAIEALAEPTVRSDAAIYSLFEQIGRTASGRFETHEADEIGITVQREACRRE